MKRSLSIVACAVICLVLLSYRQVNSDLHQGQPPLKVTVWDAFGYYMYLPAFIIYHDHTQLKWLDSIDKRYAVTGGDGWQAQKLDNGNYVFKYLGGVAIMQLPFFLIGHYVALHSHYPPDGFSPPYQYALGFGIIVYCFLGLLILRRILLRYFDDRTTAFTVVMICLATNCIQYVAIDSGQSHAYIFLLYIEVLYTTIRWHERPRISWALLTGYIIGLATMCRPTEAVMLFIPLMWDINSKEAAQRKWQMVRAHKAHIAAAAMGGLLGILPQLLYWKDVTGSFLYDVGSKWEFLNPHFRVLFGWEKGWFIYTPVTLFFIAGMFFLRKYQFQRSVLWFCLLNIYIIIAWHDWRYGGSYSTRALVQSYPVFALPFAAFTTAVNRTKWRIAFYAVCLYLLLVNLFQITQYCNTVLHYNDMNRRYYGRIYLNPHPLPTDMSLLDNDEVLNDESSYHSTPIAKADSASHLHFPADASVVIAEAPIEKSSADSWIKVAASIRADDHLWQSYLHAELRTADSVKHARVRLFSPISKSGQVNEYAFYMSIPAYFRHSSLKLYITSPNEFEGTVQQLAVTKLER